MGKDLGTYHVVVKFEDGSGFVYEFRTGARYSGQNGNVAPLEVRIEPAYASEEELLETIEFMFTEDDYGCDCSLGQFLAEAYGREDPKLPCGNTMVYSSIIIMKPNGEAVNIEL